MAGAYVSGLVGRNPNLEWEEGPDMTAPYPGPVQLVLNLEFANQIPPQLRNSQRPLLYLRQRELARAEITRRARVGELDFKLLRAVTVRRIIEIEVIGHPTGTIVATDLRVVPWAPTYELKFDWEGYGWVGGGGRWGRTVWI